jgi:hypothetical protein
MAVQEGRRGRSPETIRNRTGSANRVQKQMSAASVKAPVTDLEVSGSKLMEACGFDRRLCASIIAVRADWRQLLDSIIQPQQRRNVAAVVWQIREGLGQDAEYAREIAQSE